MNTKVSTKPATRRPIAWALGFKTMLIAAGLLAGSAGLPLGAGAAWARTAPATSQADAAVAFKDSVGLSQLPPQAREVHRRILAGGPFAYAKDGSVFGNRERALPRKARGYYREYTVPTPGSRDRGARRIVCGGRVIALPETCFYTEDHYLSFHPIDPRR